MTPDDVCILKGDHESLRRERDRIVAELGTLREDRNAMQSERDSIQALLEQLGGELDRLRSEQDRERQEHHRRGAELATLREALGASTPDDIGILKADHESLGRERDRIVAELGTLREDRNAMQSERDSIQAQLEQLGGELDRLRSEQDQERQEHHRQGAELATIREALEPFTPGEISSLKAERESFETETDRLREQVQTLRGELSARGNPAELLAQRDAEIHSARVLSDQLKEQIRHLEAALEGAQADRDQWNQEVRDQHDQLEAARAQCDRLSERIHERDEALKSSHAKLEEIAHQLRGRDDELSGMRAEQERLAEQLQAALNDAKLLLTTLAQREQEVRLESHQRHAQVGDLHRTLDEAVKNHLHERDRLAEQLRLTREQLESEVSQRTALQARIGELQDAQQKLKIDRGTVLGSERPRLTAEFHSTTGAKRSVHTEALAEVQVSAQENARPADRLNASIVALAQSLITPDADDSPAQSRVAPDADFKAARQENEVLRKKIAELEKSKQSLSSMLDNIGITVR
jgi:chromosome segregation ATPase